MKFPTHVSHYFEKGAGSLLNICNLSPAQRTQIIQREKNAETGFNRFSYGEEFFDFRLLADDLLLDLYAKKFEKRPARRPFYAVLGDADVVGGLYHDPYKIEIPITAFAKGEITFMCPDHFHLVSFMKRRDDKKLFGMQLPKDYSESKYPYFGKLLTYEELIQDFQKLEIDQHLEKQRNELSWYRYIEAQIWSDPQPLREKYPMTQEVTPEPWTHNWITHLQNYKSNL